MHPQSSDISPYLKLVACGATSVGDDSEVVGPTIDRLDYQSAVYALSYRTTLHADETLTVSASYEESDDGDTWSDPVVLQAATVAETGAEETGSEDVLGVLRFALTLGGTAKRYLRFTFVAELSYVAEEPEPPDEVDCAATLIMGGGAVLPAV